MPIAKSFGGKGYAAIKHDVFETPAWVTQYLLQHFEFPTPILEPAAGGGFMAKELRVRYGDAHVVTTDVREVPGLDFKLIDFTATLPLNMKAAREMSMCRSVVTNPPYGIPGSNLAQKFVEKALRMTAPWRGAVAMLLPYEYDATAKGGIFLEGAFEAKLVLPRRISWIGLEPKKGEPGPRQVHAWYIWRHREKFQGRKGGPRIIYPSAKEFDATRDDDTTC